MMHAIFARSEKFSLNPAAPRFRRGRHGDKAFTMILKGMLRCRR
jgi:hypothetical protein